MFYINCCSFKINLVKASVAIGFFDVFSVIVSLVLDFKYLEKFETENIIALMVLAVAILVAILLIHGALKLNRFLIIYWMVIAVIRCILLSIIEFQLLMLLPFLTIVEIIVLLISILDY
ncbi:unnamed protein product, partial [Diamesa hyperborea]